MDSMEWFLGSVAVLTAVLLVGLDTGYGTLPAKISGETRTVSEKSDIDRTDRD